MILIGIIRNAYQRFVSRRRFNALQPELQRQTDERLREVLAENKAAAASLEAAVGRRKRAAAELHQTITKTLDLVSGNRSLRDARH